MTSNQYRDFKGKAQSDTFTKIKPERSKMTFYKRALRKRMSDPFDEVKYGFNNGLNRAKYSNPDHG